MTTSTRTPLSADAAAGYPLARTQSDLSPDWLTAVLRAKGLLDTGKVSSLTSQPIGNGMLGLNLRITPQYEGEHGGAPTSLVAKMASTLAESRASGAALKLYLRETTFYQELAPRIDQGVPRTYFADISEDGQEFCLLFEDLAPARMGDQLEGCSVADARAAMKCAAAIHAPFWDDDATLHLDWMARELMVGLYVEKFPQAVPLVRKRFAKLLNPGVIDIVQDFADNIERYFALQAGPFTVSHQDYRLDNMMFDIKGGQSPVGVLDWQTLIPGPSALDVSYFVGTGLLAEDRRSNEESLVRLYHNELGTRGVADYSWEDCMRDYRLTAAHGLIMGSVGAAITTPTERGDRMLSTLINRPAQQMLELETMNLIKGN